MSRDEIKQTIDDFLSLIENGCGTSLWHFINNFEMHWGEHLRELQIYLLNLKRGT
jgi:hypothetical protein